MSSTPPPLLAAVANLITAPLARRRAPPPWRGRGAHVTKRDVHRPRRSANDHPQTKDGEVRDPAWTHVCTAGRQLQSQHWAATAQEAPRSRRRHRSRESPLRSRDAMGAHRRMGRARDDETASADLSMPGSARGTTDESEKGGSRCCTATPSLESFAAASMSTKTATCPEMVFKDIDHPCTALLLSV